MIVTLTLAPGRCFSSLFLSLYTYTYTYTYCYYYCILYFLVLTKPAPAWVPVKASFSTSDTIVTLYRHRSTNRFVSLTPPPSSVLVKTWKLKTRQGIIWQGILVLAWNNSVPLYLCGLRLQLIPVQNYTHNNTYTHIHTHTTHTHTRRYHEQFSSYFFSTSWDGFAFNAARTRNTYFSDGQNLISCTHKTQHMMCIWLWHCAGVTWILTNDQPKNRIPTRNLQTFWVLLLLLHFWKWRGSANVSSPGHYRVSQGHAVVQARAAKTASAVGGSAPLQVPGRTRVRHRVHWQSAHPRKHSRHLSSPPYRYCIAARCLCQSCFAPLFSLYPHLRHVKHTRAHTRVHTHRCTHRNLSQSGNILGARSGLAR